MDDSIILWVHNDYLYSSQFKVLMRFMMTVGPFSCVSLHFIANVVLQEISEQARELIRMKVTCDMELCRTKHHMMISLTCNSSQLTSLYSVSIYDPKVIAWVLWLLLSLAGDVEQNPGPGRSHSE